ncbi:hypothetical protein SCLCIDRAFT_1219068 [Scleroderma citrinum Foug A]|uniref:Uncharacterized protein n=1 Tax=Scleroderma citrinum Foug A TaxID=1036808 RepID=A0A0C3DP97_9AGAM|nr:hypothetical protein SCLCIDRAFT_1219068 [Scleroderma citrinum Foug A]
MWRPYTIGFRATLKIGGTCHTKKSHDESIIRSIGSPRISTQLEHAITPEHPSASITSSRQGCQSWTVV